MTRSNDPNIINSCRKAKKKSKLWSTYLTREQLDRRWEQYVENTSYRDRRDYIQGRPNYIGGYEEWQARKLGIEFTDEQRRELEMTYYNYNSGWGSSRRPPARSPPGGGRQVREGRDLGRNNRDRDNNYGGGRNR